MKTRKDGSSYTVALSTVISRLAVYTSLFAFSLTAYWLLFRLAITLRGLL